MKVKELDSVRAKLEAELKRRGLESVYAKHIRMIDRELTAYRKGGKRQERRLERIVILMAAVLVESHLR
ncbi:MAG: hypothetical protein ABS36_10330 [Acidobacteria bacterium SCN 69-37]|nr:MAG: hypothetical protein ABS36_10330 [Acidobacteria bacterium SCN 69-37]